MRRTQTAEQVLVLLIYTIKASLAELTSGGVGGNDFACGEMYAYIECLEIIQQWKDAKKFNLAGNLEEEYHLS